MLTQVPVGILDANDEVGMGRPLVARHRMPLHENIGALVGIDLPVFWHIGQYAVTPLIESFLTGQRDLCPEGVGLTGHEEPNSFCLAHPSRRIRNSQSVGIRLGQAITAIHRQVPLVQALAAKVTFEKDRLFVVEHLSGREMPLLLLRNTEVGLGDQGTSRKQA